MFSLISCGDLEPTTIKGNWVSEAVENGLHYIIQINDDDKYALKIMATDSIYTLSSGTWTYKGDTISLYSQKGTGCLIVKQLSMNIMTVQREKDKENIILSRIYNNSNSSDDFGKFSEVLALKGGFWYFRKYSVNHVFSSRTSIINFTSKKQSYDDTRRSGRDNELLPRAQCDL